MNFTSMQDNYIQRFVKYCSIGTGSKDDVEQVPSTQCQFKLAALLSDELNQLGLEDVHMDEHCYVYGYYNKQNTKKRVILLAHMDTSDAVPNENVKPQIHTFTGESIKNEFSQIDIVHLNDIKKGSKVITSDGSTLLGGDDKAGIAIITTLLEELNKISKLNDNQMDNLPSICVCFTPDEEVGNGTQFIDKQFLTSGIADCFALTIDGERNYEIAFETFNACKFQITLAGYNVHPGDAYHKMCNSAVYATKLVDRITHTFKSPQQSQKRDSYIFVMDINGTVSNTVINGLIRSFDDPKPLTQALVALVKEFETESNKTVYSELFSVKIEVKDQYQNMACYIPKDLETKLLNLGSSFGAKKALIRGGTDGSKLSQMGIPTPNVWTGSHLIHSVCEFNVVDEAIEAIMYLKAVLLSK